MPQPTRALLIPGAARRACRAVFLLQLVTLAACDDSPTAAALGEGPEAAGPRISADAVPGVVNGKIAFVGFAAFDSEIFTIESDGSGLTRLTNHAGDDSEPAWSPDGTRIVFQRAVTNPDGGIQSDIFVMNADGSAQVSLTSGPELDARPAWSPDGTKIAFDRNSGGNQDIYVMNADGSAPTRLTDDEEPDMEPAWSPDGTRIVFVSLRDDPGDEFSKADIFVMNADGTGQTNLTHEANFETSPTWSPDGMKITFSRAPSALTTADLDIYNMNPDGSGLVNLTNTPGQDEMPAWSPDGTRLAFANSRTGSREVWIANADGSAPARLTTTGGMSPAWQPVPEILPYAFTGFFAPVDNPGTVNVGKAGRGIPVKFSLGGDQGLEIFLAGFPKFVTEPCDPSDPQDPIETTTDSQSGLSYSPGSQQYTYVWRTSPALAGRCGRLELGLKDGSDHSALFRFTR